MMKGPFLVVLALFIASCQPKKLLIKTGSSDEDTDYIASGTGTGTGSCDQPKAVTEMCMCTRSNPSGCKPISGRWTFDKKSNQCEEFGYTGCGGNDNNFPSKAECVTKCNAKREKHGMGLLPPPKGICTVGGKVKEHGEEWPSPHGCSNRCFCQHGKHFCTNNECLVARKHGRGRLPPPKGICIMRGKVYEDGEKWTPPDDCNKCSCEYGKIVCTEKECPKKHGMGLLPPPKGICTMGGKMHKHGEKWDSPDGCNLCFCEYGKIGCTERGCLETKRRKRGRGLLPGICRMGGKVYKHGQKWTPPGDCNKCSCEYGKIVCTEMECPEHIGPA